MAAKGLGLSVAERPSAGVATLGELAGERRAVSRAV
jgi:hypothetical protein